MSANLLVSLYNKIQNLLTDSKMVNQVINTVGIVLYECLKKKSIYDPKSGIIDEATSEMYVKDTYAKLYDKWKCRINVRPNPKKSSIIDIFGEKSTIMLYIVDTLHNSISVA